MKRDNYINKMKDIKPKEELLQKTISNIQNSKKKKGNGLKRILTGIAAMAILSIGTVGAYVAVTGNKEILQRIGINLSEKYEENAQEIKEKNGNKNVIIGEYFDAKIVSTAIDNANIVMEIDLKVKDNLKIVSPNLNVSSVSIYRPEIDQYLGDTFIISQTQNVKQIDNGVYKVFKFVSIQETALDTQNIWLEVFGENEKTECIINFDGLYDNEELIENIDKKNGFEFELERPENLIDYSEIKNIDKELNLGDVNVVVEYVQPSDFGNIIGIYATQNNFDIDKTNDIQKIDFKITDMNGNLINIVSRNENITLDNYKNGKLTQLNLEIEIIVDDINTTDYNIELVMSEKDIVDYGKIKNAYNEVLEMNKSGEYAIDLDGFSWEIDMLEPDDYYIDDYGVYMIDKTNEELGEYYYGESFINVEE